MHMGLLPVRYIHSEDLPHCEDMVMSRLNLWFMQTSFISFCVDLVLSPFFVSLIRGVAGEDAKVVMYFFRKNITWKIFRKFCGKFV